MIYNPIFFKKYIQNQNDKSNSEENKSLPDVMLSHLYGWETIDNPTRN
jgi:hypothetical protein